MNLTMRFDKFQNLVSAFLLAGLKALAQPMEFNIAHLSNIDSSWQYALVPRMIVQNSVAHVVAKAWRTENHGVYFHYNSCLATSNNSSGTFGSLRKITDMYSGTCCEGGAGYVVNDRFFPFVQKNGQLLTLFQSSCWASLGGCYIRKTNFSLADSAGYHVAEIDKIYTGFWPSIVASTSANDTIFLIVQSFSYGPLSAFMLLKAYAGEIVDSLRIAQSYVDLPPQMSLDQIKAVHYVWAIPDSSMLRQPWPTSGSVLPATAKPTRFALHLRQSLANC
jgi:hypothetical protein